MHGRDVAAAAGTSETGVEIETLGSDVFGGTQGKRGETGVVGDFGVGLFFGEVEDGSNTQNGSRGDGHGDGDNDGDGTTTTELAMHNRHRFIEAEGEEVMMVKVCTDFLLFKKRGELISEKPAFRPTRTLRRPNPAPPTPTCPLRLASVTPRHVGCALAHANTPTSQPAPQPEGRVPSRIVGMTGSPSA